MSDDLYALYHVQDPTECGGIAFYTTRVLQDEDVLNAESVRLVDGTSPHDGQEILCGSCGSGIEQIPLYWRRYTTTFEAVKTGKTVSITEEDFDAGMAYDRAEAWIEKHYPEDEWLAEIGVCTTLRRKSEDG